MPACSEQEASAMAIRRLRRRKNEEDTKMLHDTAMAVDGGDSLEMLHDTAMAAPQPVELDGRESLETNQDLQFRKE
jgi:hypothetical protein